MTKEEIKADELIKRFYPHADCNFHDTKSSRELDANQTASAIECAIICVDEIIKTLEGMKLVFSDRKIVLKEWQSVKQILESK